jgi:hypothetical protein
MYFLRLQLDFCKVDDVAGNSSDGAVDVDEEVLADRRQKLYIGKSLDVFLGNLWNKMIDRPLESTEVSTYADYGEESWNETDPSFTYVTKLFRSLVQRYLGYQAINSQGDGDGGGGEEITLGLNLMGKALSLTDEIMSIKTFTGQVQHFQLPTFSLSHPDFNIQSFPFNIQSFPFNFSICIQLQHHVFNFNMLFSTSTSFL